MLKAAGIFLIILSGAGMGFSLSHELMGRAKAQKRLLDMLLLLKGEIRYKNASLHEAFLWAAGKMPGEYRAFLTEAAERMERAGGGSLGEIFRSCAEIHLSRLPLSEEEREAFYSLGNHLGYLDMETQMRRLELYEEELRRDIRELSGEIPGRKKVYQSLGVMGGILLAILVW